MDTPSSGLRQTLVKRPRRSRTGRRILGFCGTIAVAVGGFLYWRDLPPEVHVPTPTMPSPNALDYFLRAAKMERDGNKVDMAEDNARAVYSSLDRPYSTAEKAALVRENAPALLELRKGIAYLYQQPPVHFFSTNRPAYAQMRQLARLLVLEAQVKEAQGDWSGAASTDMDIMRMGAAVPRGGSAIAGLVGIAITAMGQKQLWKAADHLNAVQARDTAQFLSRLPVASYKLAMQQEEWLDEAGMAKSMQQPHWREAAGYVVHAGVAVDAGLIDDVPFGEKAAFWLRMQLCSKRQVMDDYIRGMDQMIADADLPYAARRPAQDPGDPFNEEMLSAFAGYRFRFTQVETRTVLLTTTLALQAYSLDHHRYPSTLQELVPSYLPALAADPFALSGPLHYRPNGSSYLLYSVGPDGKDDGGIPCKPANGAHRNNYDADDKGDIVVGVNTP